MNKECLSKKQLKFYQQRLQKERCALEFLDQACRGTKSLVLVAVRQVGLTLQHASPELQDDDEVVLAAVEQCGTALRFASEAQRGKKATVLAAITQSWRALQFASQKLQASRSIVRHALWQCGEALQFASPELRDDEGVVLEAVEAPFGGLAFASRRLQNDGYIVLRGTLHQVLHASEELRRSKDFMKQLVRKHGWYVCAFAAPELRDDASFMLEAVESWGGLTFRYASKRLREDRYCVLQVLRFSAEALQFAGKDLRKNQDVVLVAAQNLSSVQDRDWFAATFFREAGICDKDEFWQEASSAIGLPDDPNSMITTVEEVLSPSSFRINLLSGTSFQVKVRRNSGNFLTLNHLATKIAKELPKHVEAPTKQIRLCLPGDDCDLIHPSMGKRLISDFL